jgi:hypothetical protein
MHISLGFYIAAEHEMFKCEGFLSDCVNGAVDCGETTFTKDCLNFERSVADGEDLPSERARGFSLLGRSQVFKKVHERYQYLKKIIQDLDKACDQNFMRKKCDPPPPKNQLQTCCIMWIYKMYVNKTINDLNNASRVNFLPLLYLLSW